MKNDQRSVRGAKAWQRAKQALGDEQLIATLMRGLEQLAGNNTARPWLAVAIHSFLSLDAAGKLAAQNAWSDWWSAEHCQRKLDREDGRTSPTVPYAAPFSIVVAGVPFQVIPQREPVRDRDGKTHPSSYSITHRTIRVFDHPSDSIRWSYVTHAAAHVRAKLRDPAGVPELERTGADAATDAAFRDVMSRIMGQPNEGEEEAQ